MTSLTILPNTDKKTLKLTGKVAAGEHVAVSVSGGADWIGEGKALRLRVIFGMKQVAMFPLVTEEDAAADTSGETVADEWAAGGEGDADAICTLNLFTIPAEKYLKFGGNCLWVLDDIENNTLYGTGELEVLPWPKRNGADVPYSLDEYPDIVAEMQEAWVAYQATVNAALASHEAAVAAAIATKADATALATETSNRESGDAALGTRVSAVEATTATHTSQISSLQTDVASKADATATSAALLALDSGKADKATTLAGYGITDALISNGTVILGSSSITPLTEHQDISGKADKSTTYTKTEVDAIVQALKTGSRQIVETLPASGQPMVIYMVPKSASQTNNAYDEYIWTAAGAWEKIGDTEIDLSGYVQKESGKGLSTNDYTTAEKQKLAGIAAGAEVNVIETVKVNGTALTPSSKAVDITVPTGTAASKDVPTSGNASTSQVVMGNDSRLSDARTPTAHKSSHATGGSDAIAPSDIGAAASTHTHSASDITSGLATVATTGSYNDLSNKPTIPTVPTNVGAFANDAGYLTAQDITGKADKTDIAPDWMMTIEVGTVFELNELCSHYGGIYRCILGYTFNGEDTPSGDPTHWAIATVEDVLAALRTAVGNKVAANTAITGATKCKITYDSKGLVTGGADLAASDIPTLTTAKLSDFATAIRYAMPESVALVAESDAATLVCADRAVTNATIASGFSTLNLTFPAEVSGYVRDFYLRVTVAAGQSAPALSLPQGVTIENAGGAVPEIADGEASAAATTLVWFSETAPGIFTAKSETVKAVA